MGPYGSDCVGKPAREGLVDADADMAADRQALAGDEANERRVFGNAQLDFVGIAVEQTAHHRAAEIAMAGGGDREGTDGQQQCAVPVHLSAAYGFDTRRPQTNLIADMDEAAFDARRQDGAELEEFGDSSGGGL